MTSKFDRIVMVCHDTKMLVTREGTFISEDKERTGLSMRAFVVSGALNFTDGNLSKDQIPRLVKWLQDLIAE